MTTYPQLYVILVGPPATGKSTAMEIGENLLLMIPDFPLTPSSTTREALLEVMQENKIEFSLDGRNYFYHQAATFATELKGFIGGKHINESLIEIMTTLWNRQVFEYRPKNSKKIVIPCPYFTLIGCCTLDWIQKNLKQDLITDGFARRTIFVVEEKPYKLIPWPSRSEEFVESYKRIKVDIKRINSIKGKFRLTEEAKELWRVLYLDKKGNAHKQDKMLQSYYGSRQELMLKVCMCLSAANSSIKIIDRGMMEIANLALEQSDVNLPKIYSGMGRNELRPYHDDISDLIRDKSIMSDAELLEKFKDDVRLSEYAEIMDILITTKKIVRIEGGYKSLLKNKTKTNKDLLQLVADYEFNSKESVEDTDSVDPECVASTKEIMQKEVISERLSHLKKGILIKGKL